MKWSTLRAWGWNKAALTALAALVYLVVAEAFGPEGGGPLQVTLQILPLSVLAFAGIEALGVRAGGRRIAAVTSWVHLVAVLSILIAGDLADHPGVPLPPEAVMAGLVLLLAHRIACQVTALRPVLGRRLPECPPAVFFLLPLAVYLTLLPWTAGQRPPDGDEPYYLLITHSLVHDLDADLADEYRDEEWRAFLDRPLGPQPGDPVGADGEQYSRHNLTLPLVLAPGYRLAGGAGALATMALLTAALAWAGLRLASRYAPTRPGAALVAWALFAFAPPLLLYSGQVWVEVPAALVTVLALDRIRARRDAGSGAARGVLGWLPLLLLVGLLPLLKMRFLLLAGSLLALAWWHSGRRPRPLLVFAGGLGLFAAAVLLYNQAVYGNPLKIHTWRELWPGGYALGDYLAGLSGLFFDSSFGLFASAPLWMLLLPAAVAALVAERRGGAAPGLLPARRRGNPVLFDLAVLAVPYLGLVAPRSEWYGGWSPPFRYALVILPLLAIFLVPLSTSRRRGGARALTAAFGGLTLALTVLWVAVPGWTYSFAAGRGDLLDLASISLGADAACWLPSSVRPRPASWLWPVLALAVLPIVWRWPRRLRGARSWGVAAVLALIAGGVVAAERLPTRTVELEDPWVEKSGGAVFPEPWVTERTRFRGGWTLREGESLEVPVVAGGEGVSIRLAVQFVRNRRAPLDLEVRAGERLLARWRGSDDRRWSELELGPFGWPAGEPLVIVASAGGRRADERPNGVVLDRLELTWH